MGKAKSADEIKKAFEEKVEAEKKSQPVVFKEEPTPAPVEPKVPDTRDQDHVTAFVSGDKVKLDNPVDADETKPDEGVRAIVEEHGPQAGDVYTNAGQQRLFIVGVSTELGKSRQVVVYRDEDSRLLHRPLSDFDNTLDPDQLLTRSN